MSKWTPISEKKPQGGQHILAKFKHGIIDCAWDSSTGVGYTYIWREQEFYVYEWMPIETFKEWAEDPQTKDER